MATLHPRDLKDICQIVSEAAINNIKLEVCGGGTKSDFGAPRDTTIISLEAIEGVVDYDPAELVLTVRAGTKLAVIEALIASEGQMLAFEPWGESTSTIGGAIAAGVAGSRRVTAGSARDHLLGFHAISGRGKTYVAGAKVVKNVTGYDLPKLMAGSWGRLGPMTELTLKVLPRPRVSVTLAAEGLSPGAAHAVMACALGSNTDVSAAAHLQRGLTLLRVAGFAPSVEARCRLLSVLLENHCGLHRVDETEAAPFWTEAMTGTSLSGPVHWRVHLPPRNAPALIERLSTLEIEWAIDWGGGLVWISLDSCGLDVREAAARLEGDAMLVRAPPAMRTKVAALPPHPAAVAALEQRVRRAFDPRGIFATARFSEDANADQLPA